MISESDCIEQVQLASYVRHSFDRGRPFLVVLLWRALGRLLPIAPSSRLRKLILQLFGAKISTGVIIQPGVRVRYPWRLIIGRDSWIGEACYIDNWAPIKVGGNSCISQFAYLCTGNHDWTDPQFPIVPKPIVIGDSAWVGARAVLGPGVELGTGAIAALGSVVNKNVPAWEIHSGNPAQFIKVRLLRKSENNGPVSKPEVVVVGPAHSRGGITSVISAHSQMEAWETFGCRKLNTFTDGGAFAKLLTAARAYVSAPVVFSNCSIVHFHVAGRSSMARKLPLLLLAKFMRKRTVVHVHAPSTAAVYGSHPKWLFPLICQLSDRLIALSPWWAQHFRENGATAPISVIANPVVIPPNASNCAAASPKVLFVGKLEARKGYADLIRAAATVLQLVPEAEFILAGHGEIEEARSLSQQLGIEKSITLTGWQSGRALADLYRNATLFCLPSYDEGLPMSVLEAMSWALPIVTTPVGGIPDIITNGLNGIIVRPGEISELATTIVRLLKQSPEERNCLGLAAREEVIQTCELKHVSRKLAQVYEDLLSHKQTLRTEATQ